MLLCISLIVNKFHKKAKANNVFISQYFLTFLSVAEPIDKSLKTSHKYVVSSSEKAE